MIAALFVETNGAYFGLTDVDPWDQKRDARLYDGPHPVVAHPPCSVWCQLAHVNQARYGHRVGDDGGCFEAALKSVRNFGGVLEHPAESIAWSRFGLPPPRLGRWRSGGDGYPYGQAWVTKVYQRAYGHRASKGTWLYSVGAKPPDLDWSDPEPIATVSFLTNHGGGNLPRLGKKEAKASPPAFRDLLIDIARRQNRFWGPANKLTPAEVAAVSTFIESRRPEIESGKSMWSPRLLDVPARDGFGQLVKP